MRRARMINTVRATPITDSVSIQPHYQVLAIRREGKGVTIPPQTTYLRALGDPLDRTDVRAFQVSWTLESICVDSQFAGWSV